MTQLSIITVDCNNLDRIIDFHITTEKNQTIHIYQILYVTTKLYSDYFIVTINKKSQLKKRRKIFKYFKSICKNKKKFKIKNGWQRRYVKLNHSIKGRFILPNEQLYHSLGLSRGSPSWITRHVTSSTYAVTIFVYTYQIRLRSAASNLADFVLSRFSLMTSDRRPRRIHWIRMPLARRATTHFFLHYTDPEIGPDQFARQLKFVDVSSNS